MAGTILALPDLANGEKTMKDDGFDRRSFLKGSVAGGAAALTGALPLTAAELDRAGFAAANAHCRKAYGKSLHEIAERQRDEFLLGLREGKLEFEGGPPARVFFAMLYENVMEGMFSDPIYGGNRDKAGWKLIGFPGVIAVHYSNVEKYRGKKYEPKPVSIQDMS